MESSPTATPHLSLVVIALLFMVSLGFAQTSESRGVGVKVTDANGDVINLYDESHALLIGVSDYSNGWRSLPGVKSDIEAIQTVLRLHGFEVQTLPNPTGRMLNETIKDFIARHGQRFGNRVLIYFAGHGETLKTLDGREVGYIVPTDAPLSNRSLGQFKQTAISMDMIEAYARLIESKHALFVFDSCFSGSIFEANREAPPSAITNRALQPVRQFITAGTSDQVVPDRSIFREQFVEALNGRADLNGDGYITGSELGEFLEDRVTNYSRSAQTPRWGKIRNANLDKGNFVFVSPRVTNTLITVAKIEQSKQAQAATQPAYANELCGIISALLASSRKGFRDIVGEATYKFSTHSFKSTVILQGAKSSSVIPGSSVQYVLVDSENVGDVGSEYYRIVSKLSDCLPSWKQKQTEPELTLEDQIGTRSTKFRDKPDGIIVEVSHTVYRLPKPSRRYYLRLEMSAPGQGYW